MMKIKNVFSNKKNGKKDVQTNLVSTSKEPENKPEENPENEIDPIFEDFELEDSSLPGKVSEALNMSKRSGLRSPLQNFQNSSQKSDFDDDDDDDFADIEKSYQEFLNRRKKGTRFERRVKEKEYSLDDFKRDFFEKRMDISDLLDKMPVELKDLLLKTLLSRKDK